MATEDILINDGDGFVSLSELAAEQVDVSLPISSTDNKVTLSDDNGTYRIETGDPDTSKAVRVVVDENGLVGVCSTDKGMGAINSGLKIGTDKSIGSQIIVYGEVASSYGQFVGVNLDMETATEFVAYQSAQCTNYAGDTAKVASYKDFKTANHDAHVTAQYGFYSSVAPRNDTNGNPLTRFQFYAATSAPSYFGGAVQTSRIVGAAAPDTDASIDLGANFTATAGSAFFEMRPGGNCGINTNGEALKARFDVKGTIAANSLATIDSPAAGVPSVINRDMTAGGVYSGITFFQDVDAVGISIASRSKLIVTEDDIRAVDGYTPTQPNSIATKAYADTKAGLWTGTQAEYDALGIYNNQTLYCITD